MRIIETVDRLRQQHLSRLVAASLLLLGFLFALTQAVWQASASPTFSPGIPTANAGGPYSTNEGAQLTFSGAASDPEDASETLTYEWDFEFDGSFNVAGSGTNLTGPTHAYTDNGSFTVALRVRDSANNLSSISTGPVTVVNVSPGANAGGPYSVDSGTALTFSGSATDPGNDALTYEWDFEYDWATFNSVGSTTASGVDLASPTHTYAQGGTFTVALRVHDDDEAVSSVATAEVTVRAQTQPTPRPTPTPQPTPTPTPTRTPMPTPTPVQIAPPTPTPTPVTADANGDGVVSVADLRIVAAALGTSDVADLNRDGIVDVLDLALVGINLDRGEP